MKKEMHKSTTRDEEKLIELAKVFSQFEHVSDFFPPAHIVVLQDFKFRYNQRFLRIYYNF